MTEISHFIFTLAMKAILLALLFVTLALADIPADKITSIPNFVS